MRMTVLAALAMLALQGSAFATASEMALEILIVISSIHFMNCSVL